MRLPHAPKSGFGQFNHPVLMEDEIQARDIGQIIAAVIVGNLGACFDVLDGAYDDLVAYPVGLGIGPARMIYVASEESWDYRAAAPVAAAAGLPLATLKIMNPAGLAAHPHSESSYREEGASVHVDAAFNISSHHTSQSVHGKISAGRSPRAPIVCTLRRKPRACADARGRSSR